MSQRVVRVVPVGPGTEIRGAQVGSVPCPTHWPDGAHAFHHCMHVVTRYAPVAPLKDGYVEDVHDGPHVCSCGAKKEAS
jgi:hypothetical protein